MVYCKLKESKEAYAVYAIGTTVEDMTGEIVFYKDLKEPKLVKQAEQEPVRITQIAKIYGKYRQEFEQGNFGEKLAYEIG